MATAGTGATIGQARTQHCLFSAVFGLFTGDVRLRGHCCTAGMSERAHVDRSRDLLREICAVFFSNTAFAISVAFYAKISNQKMKKAAEEEEEGPILGKVGTHLTMGIVGLPNVGKSTVRACMLLVLRGPRVEASLTHALSCSISSPRWACRQRTFLSGKQSACVNGCSCSHAHTRICSTIDRYN